jgi:hypothetical protein
VIAAGAINSYTNTPYIEEMSKALSHILWRTLGGVFGVAVLVSMAIAISRIAQYVSIA